MRTQVASASPSVRNGPTPCAALTPFSISSSSVRTWRVFAALVMTNASTTPKSSPMARTTVSRPSLASADSAAVATVGGSWTCTPNPGVNGARPGSPPSARTSRPRWHRRSRPSACGLAAPPSPRPADRSGAAPARGPRPRLDPLAAPSPWPAWRSSAHSVQSAALDATDADLGHQTLDRLAPGQALTHLRAGDGHLGAVDPDHPPTRGAAGGRAGGPGDHGHRDEALPLVPAGPG